jgi:hypothetical protein
MMKSIPIILLVLGLTFSLIAQAPTEKRSTFLDVLKVGEKVSLKEVAGRYEISLFEGIPDAQRYTVKAIEADHLVVEDITGVNELFIPVYSVRAIVRVKLPRK